MRDWHVWMVAPLARCVGQMFVPRSRLATLVLAAAPVPGLRAPVVSFAVAPVPSRVAVGP